MNQWKPYQIEAFKALSGLQLLTSQPTVASVNRDFGGLHKGQASAIFKPETRTQAQVFLRFCYEKKLPVIIRCNGLSQSGQAIAQAEQVIMDVSALNHSIVMRENTILAGCSARWGAVLTETLKHNKIPPVFPYNTRLSIGGVLSVGGLGSGSSQNGTCSAHVSSMQVLCMDGRMLDCNQQQHYDLMQSSLTGAGQFALIYSVELKLVDTAETVYTRDLSFDNARHWINEQFLWRDRNVDYLEANGWFADPLSRVPYSKPVYRISLCSDNPKKLNHSTASQSHSSVSSMATKDYALRHEARISRMMSAANVDKLHPWFECYATREVISKCITFLSHTFPQELGPVFHCFPVARYHAPLFQMPKGSDIMAFNILSAGISEREFYACKHWILEIDALLHQFGGKRYISSWIANSHKTEFWQDHHGENWEMWQSLKKRYDPFRLLGVHIAPNC